MLALAGCGGSHKIRPESRAVSQSAMGSVHPAGWGSTPPGFVAPTPLPTAVPTATMYDAVTVGNIPAGPFAVAGYPFGRYVTWGALLSRFPGAHHVSIAVAFLERAMCGDFEPGDMDGSQAGQWARIDMGSFSVPCEYGDLSNMPAIEASDRAALGPNWRSKVLLWLAWYTGRPGLVGGFDGVQYTDTCFGRNLDCSTVTLNFLRIASPPYTPPQPLPTCIHRRQTRAACAAAKAKILSDIRAAQSSWRAWVATDKALAAHRCEQPYRRAVCRTLGRRFDVFDQRVRWFEAATQKLEAAN